MSIEMRCLCHLLRHRFTLVSKTIRQPCNVFPGITTHRRLNYARRVSSSKAEELASHDFFDINNVLALLRQSKYE